MGIEKLFPHTSRVIGAEFLISKISDFINWCHANSLTPLTINLGCCAQKLLDAGDTALELSNFGSNAVWSPPQHSNLLIVAGSVTEKMGLKLIQIYEQMPSPKWVVALGSCAISGGQYFYDSYSVVRGANTVIPVDLYIPGCPPDVKDIVKGVKELQKKIKSEGYRDKFIDAKLDFSQFAENAEQVSEDRVKILHRENWKTQIHPDIQAEMHRQEQEVIRLAELAERERIEAEELLANSANSEEDTFVGLDIEKEEDNTPSENDEVDTNSELNSSKDEDVEEDSGEENLQNE